MRCPECGFLNKEDAKFCSGCGTIIAHLKEVEGKEKKMLTVLFGDIVNFTGISEKLDVEQITDLLTACFGKIGMLAKKYGGMVNKLIGDEVMILYGLHDFRKSDSRRAISTAIEIHEFLSNFDVKKIVRDVSDRISIRIGIDRGIVGVDRVGKESQYEYMVLGRPVEQASLLEEVAEGGMTLLGEGAYNSSKDEFQFKRFKKKEGENLITGYELVRD